MIADARPTSHATQIMLIIVVIMSVLGIIYQHGQGLEGRFFPVAGDLHIVKTKLYEKGHKITFAGYFDKIRDCEFVDGSMVSYLIDENGGQHRGAFNADDQPIGTPSSRIQGLNYFNSWSVLVPETATTVTGLKIEVQHKCHFLWRTKSIMNSKPDATLGANPFMIEVDAAAK